MSSSPNATQIAYWNGPIGQAWATSHAKRDRDHTGITEPLIAFAAIKPGENVLDTGCGSGTTTLMLAERAGRAGSVLGMDLSAPMLAVAKQRAESTHSIAQFVQADVSDYPFEKHTFDAGFSQFGVMFFADPIVAFRNIRHALKRQARLVFACWRSPAEHTWSSVPESAAKPFLPSAPPADPNAPGRFSLQQPDRIKQLLAGAGFYGIEIHKQDARTFAGATPEEAAASAIDSGPLQRTLSDADDTTRMKVREAVTARLAREMQSDGIYLNSAAWLVRAFA